jgi:asparagine synthase (glutamine-hydrolysing)
MLRYLALLWNFTDGSQADIVQTIARDVGAKLTSLQPTLHTNGLLVWSNGAHADQVQEVSSERAVGAVLGRMFKRETKGREAHVQTPLPVTPDSNIAAEGADHLLQHYWGRYVAFVRSERTGLTWVLRDPSGGLPCFFTSHRGVFVFFSHLEDCLALALTSVSINWNFIAAYLVNPALQQPQTGVREVSELSKGECVEIRGSSYTRRLCWNPLHIARTNPIDDSATAIEAMREIIPACVATWAASFHHILHRVSGGLDSSIVLACLSKAAPRLSFRCVTYYDHSVWGDERGFSRLAARHAQCELIERMHDSSRIDFDSLLSITRSCSPTWYLLNFAHHLTYSELASEYAADALFSGHGGDAIFFREPGQVLPVADYLYRHPFGARAARVAFDTAAASGRAIWNVAPTALLHGLLRRPINVLHDIDEGLEFVEPDVVAEVKRSSLLQPSWLTSADRTPPGKLRHIEGMNMPEWTHQPYALDTDPEEVSPLLSQPVLELLLRIQTYLLMEGGRDRMLARRAFAPDLPPQLVARVSKGGQNDFSLQMLRQNESRIRELVLDGQLCKEGLLNRRKMEALLASEYDSNTDGLMEILHTHLSVEIWLHSLVQA